MSLRPIGSMIWSPSEFLTCKALVNNSSRLIGSLSLYIKISLLNLNFSEFLFWGQGLINLSETADSEVRITINGINFGGLASQKNSGTSDKNSSQFIHMKYNGFFWEICLTDRSISSEYYSIYTNLKTPYSKKLYAGICNTLRLSGTASAYVPISGKITIYAR